MPRSSRRIVRLARICLGLSLLAVSRVALADGDAPAAQALFDEAKQLMAQGLYAQACPKLQESLKLDPGMGTQFHLGDCLQHLGRNASAWAIFREVESQAHATGQSSRERVAHDRATALEPFLSRIVVSPQSAGENPRIEVRRDGVSIGRGEWDVPVPVDPGPHVVTLIAPNKRPWETRVDVLADGRVVRIDLPRLADLSDVAAPAPPAPPPPSPPAVAAGPHPARAAAPPLPPSEPTTALEDHGGFLRAIGWFFVGAGAVGLGAATYFGLQWTDDHNRSLAHCSGTCDAVGSAARDDAKRDANLVEAAAGAGGIALLVGTMIVVAAPGPRIVVNNAARVEVAPVVGSTRGGVVLSGVW
jgi:serine/threonine-protein kinase